MRKLIAHTTARAAVVGNTELTGQVRRLTMPDPALREESSFFTTLSVMNVISHALEERAVALQLPVDVYAGFQRLALMRPQLPRYRALLRHAGHVYAYGLDDAPAGGDVDSLRHPSLIRFKIDPRLGTEMERFWFVVVDHSQLRTALLAEHIGGDLYDSGQGARSYRGVWTFDPARVTEIVAALRRAGRMLYNAR